MNGGPGKFSERTEQGLHVPRGTHPVHSEAMAQYAIQRGVPRELKWRKGISPVKRVGEL